MRNESVKGEALMGVLEYIGLTLVLPNLSSIFISNHILSIRDKGKQREIRDKIKDFNSNFEGYEVDCGSFQKYFEETNIIDTIFDYIFARDSLNRISEEEFVAQIAADAICFVNKAKEEIGHPAIKNQDDFYKYFQSLIKIIKDIRYSLLSLSEKAQVGMINNNLGQLNKGLKDGFSEVKELIRNMQKVNELNPLAKEKLNTIRELIDLGQLDEASDKIDVAILYKEYFEGSQREELYYLKGLIFFHQENLKGVERMKDAIASVNSNSKYIYELDYRIACEENNQSLFDLAIGALRSIGVGDDKILPKMAYFEIAKENYDAALSLLLENQAMKKVLLNNPESYYYVGIVYLEKKKFEKAVEQLKNAYKIKQHPIYKYNRIIAELIPLFNNREQIINPSDKFIEELKQLSSELYSLVDYFKTLDYSANVQFWWYYFNSLILIDLDLFFDAFDKIKEDIKNDMAIKGILAEAFYMKKDFIKAKPILEEIGSLNKAHLIKYLDILRLEGHWDKVGQLIDDYSIDDYDDEGIIATFNIERLINNKDIKNAKLSIEKWKERYQNSAYFIDTILSLAEQIKDEDIKDEFIYLANKNIREFRKIEKLNLAKTLLKFDKLKEAKVLLYDIIYEYDEALNYYLNILSHEAKEVDDIEKVICFINEIYNNGCKSNTLLKHKVLSEMKKEDWRCALNTLEEYHKDDIDYFYSYNKLICKYKLGDLDNIRDESLYLLSTDNIAAHIIVARCDAELGDWRNAQEIAMKALYKYGDSIGMEDLYNYVAMYLSRVSRDEEETVEYEETKEGSVITLKSDQEYIRKICIHSNDELVEKSGEKKLGCENFKKKDILSLILLSEGKKGESVSIDNIDYKVAEIVNIHAYFFRYCLSKLQNEYPNHGLFKTVSGQTPQELYAKMQEVMKEVNEQSKKKLEFYNFSIEMGVPLTYLANNDLSDYMDKIIGLLEMKGQKFYSGEINRANNKKYILSLSSILIMKFFGVLDKVEEFSDKCFITKETKKIIKESLYNTITKDRAIYGSTFIDEQGILRFTEFTDEHKQARKKFWNEIIKTTQNIESIEVEVSENKIYNVLQPFIHMVDVESIEATQATGGIFVSEDLFLRKVSLSIYNNIVSSNFLGMLFSENVLTISEIYDLIIKLSQSKYVYCLDSDVLFDLFLDFMKDSPQIGYWVMYSKLGVIFQNILEENMQSYYWNIYQDFLMKMREYRGFELMLYFLVQRPLKLQPFEKLRKDVLIEIFKGNE